MLPVVRFSVAKWRWLCYIWAHVWSDIKARDSCKTARIRISVCG